MNRQRWSPMKSKFDDLILQRVTSGLFIVLLLPVFAIALPIAIPFWLIGFITEKVCKVFGVEW